MTTKTKWKCETCQKSLASKQTAINHVKVFHKESDPNVTISKVRVQISEDKDQIGNPKPKKDEKVKNKAFKHFSQLSNIFSDESIVEKFSFGKPKQSKSVMNQPNISEANSVPPKSYKF